MMLTPAASESGGMFLWHTTSPLLICLVDVQNVENEQGASPTIATQAGGGGGGQFLS